MSVRPFRLARLLGALVPAALTGVPASATIPAGALAVESRIPAAPVTDSVVVSRDGTRVYTTTRTSVGSCQLAVLDAASRTTIALVPLGTGNAFGLAVSPDGSRVFVVLSKCAGAFCAAEPSRVAVVDTASLTVIAQVSLGILPVRAAISPDGSRLYVTDRLSPGTVLVLDTASFALVATVALGPTALGPVAIALSPDGSRAYAANRSSSNLSVLDTASLGVVATIPLSLAPSGAQTWLAIAPDGRRAYVTTGVDPRIAVVDLDPASPTLHTETALLSTSAPLAVRGLAVTPDGARLLAVDGIQRVLVIDVAEGSPTWGQEIDAEALAPTPTSPWDVAASGDCGSVAWVTLGDSGEVAHLISRVAPAIAGVRPDRDELWPPNHKMVEVEVDYQASDDCGEPLTSGCTLQVTSDESEDGRGDGTTSGDFEVLDDHRVRLRAERSGAGDGRTYTIEVTCTDAWGSTAATSTRVLVPHER